MPLCTRFGLPARSLRAGIAEWYHVRAGNAHCAGKIEPSSDRKYLSKLAAEWGARGHLALAAAKARGERGVTHQCRECFPTKSDDVMMR